MKQNNFRAEAIPASANIEKIHLIYTKIEEDFCCNIHELK